MKKNLVITIGGPPGAGTTSAANRLSEIYGLQYISAGNIFRTIAEERKIKVEELSESAEEEVDFQVDNRTKEFAAAGTVVIEGKLAAWMVKELADVKIWLTAPLETRANRVLNDEKKRIAEDPESLEQVKDELNRRFLADKERYQKYYQVDLDDESIYDLVIDTKEQGIEEVINQIT